MEGVGKDAAEHGEQKNEISKHWKPLHRPVSVRDVRRPRGKEKSVTIDSQSSRPRGQLCVRCSATDSEPASASSRLSLLDFDVPGEADKAQCGDAIPVRVELVPGQAVTGGLRMGVMVVVPSFAKGQQRHPEAVARGVSGGKSARAPHVGGGVDQPGGVQAEHGAKEDAPAAERAIRRRGRGSRRER